MNRTIIPLPKGKFTKVSEQDYPELSKHKWYVREGYVVRRGEDGKTIRMHRAIMNPGAREVVDHINGDPLDNRRENLRVCTQANNQWNRRKTKKKTSSKYKGVNLHLGKYWRAAIKVGPKVKYLGLFTTEERAARAYDAAALEHFGPYAQINFPNSQVRAEYLAHHPLSKCKRGAA